MYKSLLKRNNLYHLENTSFKNKPEAFDSFLEKVSKYQNGFKDKFDIDIYNCKRPTKFKQFITWAKSFQGSVNTWTYIQMGQLFNVHPETIGRWIKKIPWLSYQWNPKSNLRKRKHHTHFLKMILVTDKKKLKIEQDILNAAREENEKTQNLLNGSRKKKKLKPIETSENYIERNNRLEDERAATTIKQEEIKYQIELAKLEKKNKGVAIDWKDDLEEEQETKPPPNRNFRPINVK